MIDLTTVIGDAAAVVDPKGENEDISVLCGLIVWAVEHPDEYSGWDVETLSATRWNFGADATEADETARRLIDVGWRTAAANAGLPGPQLTPASGVLCAGP